MTIFMLLFISIIFEVVASSSLKLTQGFKKLRPTLVVIVAYALSFYFLSQVLRQMPIGNAYAIWGGLGTVLTGLFGVVYYKEILSKQKVIGIICIVLGVVVLNVLGGAH